MHSQVIEVRDRQSAACGTAAASQGAASRSTATWGQEWHWMLERLGAGSSQHLVAQIREEGVPDLTAVGLAMATLYERHAVLRTGVRVSTSGGVEQFTLPRVPDPRRLVQVTEDDTLPCAPPALDEPPLLRARVSAQDQGCWTLDLVTHRVAADEPGLRCLAREFRELYAEAMAGHIPGPAASAPLLEKAGSESSLRYWRERLAGAAPPRMASDPAGAEEGSAAAEPLPVTVSADLGLAIEKLAARCGTESFSALMAGFTAVLARWSGATDLLVGTETTDRRGAHEAPGSPVGPRVEILPLRLDLEDDPGFTELTGRAHAAWRGALAHADLPFGQIVREAPHGADRTEPLIRHLLTLHDYAVDDGITLVRPGSARVDVELNLTKHQDGSLTGDLLYRSALFDAAGAQGFVDAWLRLMGAAVQEPARPVSMLPVLGPEESTRLAKEGRSEATAAPGGPLLPEWFEAQVDATPDADAVAGPDGSIVDYRELDRRANRLAHRLIRLGVTPGDRVAVCLDRGIGLSMALLGILKAGAAYLPLAPDLPAHRTAHLLRDGVPMAVVTTPERFQRMREALEAATEGTDEVSFVGLDEPETDRSPDTRPRVPVQGGDAAYVLYTSGSTGQPKGAVNTHAGLANRLRWHAAEYPLGSTDRVLQKTPVSFDVSVWELFLPLVVGATLVHAKPDGHRDPGYLHQILDEQRITICHFVPSMLAVFLEWPSGPHPHLLRVVCSGEELTPALARAFFDRLPETDLLNLYGPTEAAVDVSAHRVTRPVPPGRIPIGTAVPGVELHVLDKWLEPQPTGVPGELYIGGVQLARGYHGRPELTADKFIPHPFAPGERLYATGDKARKLPGGELEYLGRLDFQVKVRGQRVEPAEIEAVLLAHPDVTGAVVTVPTDTQGELFLVAYAVCSRQVDPTELRTHLAERLPASMVPTVLRLLDAMPTTVNGKIDRAALPPAGPHGQLSGGFLAPRTPLERYVADLWAEALEVERVGVRDDFFSLGGHSLSAVRLLGLIKAASGVDLPPALLLTGTPTVESLSLLLQKQVLAQAPPAALEELLDQLADLSDEEVAEHLARYARTGLDARGPAGAREKFCGRRGLLSTNRQVMSQ
ncbi:amino acid adenylation domain-containing protein [Streptomyces sp. NPDC016172]|uniref:non-ribosomal peptide synthetase n=1 Tax=Streptomyces sp. NPDC016172 TaxID=3364964 RepID=UPI0036F6521F